MKLKEKIALITGGSRGIGLEISKQYAAEGATVVIVARNHEQAADVVAVLRAQGHKAYAYAADCSRVAEIETMVSKVTADLGGLDILVGNAGSFQTMPISETTEENWDQMIDLNLKGAFFLVKAAVPHLEERGGGKIVLVSSIAGVRGFPNCPAYCASKGGLVNLTKALACELAAKNINVNTVAPGNTETSMNAHLRGPENAAYMKLMSDRTPTGRAFINPKEIASAAVFLATPEAKAMHGSVLIIDDGWCAW